ncbi:MAG TPA: hypothetical protein VHC69_31305 [Polyangiaceae bacterium]|nr:hypothetical protein [Polyangiaceae bacterium]
MVAFFVSLKPAPSRAALYSRVPPQDVLSYAHHQRVVATKAEEDLYAEHVEKLR